MQTFQRPLRLILLCACMLATVFMFGCSSKPSVAQRKIYTELDNLMQDPTGPVPSVLSGKLELSIYIDDDYGYEDNDPETDKKLQQGYISRNFYRTIDFIVEDIGYLETDKFYRVSGEITGYNVYDIDDEGNTGCWLEITLSKATPYKPLVDYDKITKNNTVVVNFETPDNRGTASYKFTGFALDGGNVVAKFTMTNNYEKAIAPQLEFLSFYSYSTDSYIHPSKYPDATTEPGKTRDFEIVLDTSEGGAPSAGSEIGVEYFNDEFNLEYNVIMTLK